LDQVCGEHKGLVPPPVAEDKAVTIPTKPPIEDKDEDHPETKSNDSNPRVNGAMKRLGGFNTVSPTSSLSNFGQTHSAAQVLLFDTMLSEK